MKQRALVIDSTRLFQNIIGKIMASAGVECHFYSTGKEALEASKHPDYSFILVSRTLSDTTAEIFLQRFVGQHGIGQALPIMITSSDDKQTLQEAKNAGYHLVYHKKEIEKLQNVIIKILNSLTLELEAKILFVEDSQSVADMVVALFQQNEANIQHVKRISDMQQAFNEQEFELVITDYYLKDNETGDEVISHIRDHEDSNKANTPILVISGESNQQKRTSFLRNGANDFILKPYDNDELLVRASNLISNFRLLKRSKQMQQELEKLAFTDQLTQLCNRHSLYNLAPKYVSNALRHHLPLSLLVIDLDHFKNINDTLGHSTGDLVLQAVSEVLQNSCRTEDIVARFGGEEFVMLLTNSNLENSAIKAEKIRQSIEESKPEGLTVTSSIGVAELQLTEDFEALFERADKAVYEAKETGRNKVVQAT